MIREYKISLAYKTASIKMKQNLRNRGVSLHTVCVARLKKALKGYNHRKLIVQVRSIQVTSAWHFYILKIVAKSDPIISPGLSPSH